MRTLCIQSVSSLPAAPGCHTGLSMIVMVHRQLTWGAAVVAGRIRSSRHTTSMHWDFPLPVATYIRYSRFAAYEN